MNDLYSLPSRIFLDFSTLQILDVYGAFIWDGYEIEADDDIWSIPDGIENLQALRNIFIINDRAHFEFALSRNSFVKLQLKVIGAIFNGLMMSCIIGKCHWNRMMAIRSMGTERN